VNKQANMTVMRKLQKVLMALLTGIQVVHLHGPGSFACSMPLRLKSYSRAKWVSMLSLFATQVGYKETLLSSYTIWLLVDALVILHT
jgi:hypothetical protein